MLELAEAEAWPAPDTFMVTGPATSGALKFLVNRPSVPVVTELATVPSVAVMVPPVDERLRDAFSTPQPEPSTATPLIVLVPPAMMSGAVPKLLILVAAGATTEVVVRTPLSGFSIVKVIVSPGRTTFPDVG